MADTAPAPFALVLTASTGVALPPPVAAWLARQALEQVPTHDADELVGYAMRSRPAFVLADLRGDDGALLDGCRRVKRDPFSAVVPLIALCDADPARLVVALESGADEAVTAEMTATEIAVRLQAALARAERDLGVHPSTRLPGTTAIKRVIGERLSLPTAVCYVDLDHFKEFNDRYGYANGDRIIRLLANLLHDTVASLIGDEGFVGHIGGDDFIMVLPRERVEEVCSEIVSTFDTLIPYQYAEADRRAGYFFGKDRRGQLHRVPLMTLSIGVVTNARRVFTSVESVETLATEMKTYAKSLPGSVYAIDRRTDDRPGVTSPQPDQGALR